MAIDLNQDAMNSIDDVNMTLDSMNSGLWTNMDMADIDKWINIVGYVSMSLNILSIIFFITSAWGLYKISKNLWDKYPWLAFIPLVQIYTFIKTAGYTFWKGLINLIGRFILWFILFAVLMAAFWMIVSSMWLSLIWMWIASAIMWFVWYIIMYIFIFSFIYSWIAARTWESWITILWMMLFPWFMLIKVANRMPQRTNHSDIDAIRPQVQTWNSNEEL